MSLVGFGDNAPIDRVFFGRARNSGLGASNTVIRDAALSAEVSGPGQFGDEIDGVGPPAAVVSSTGDLYYAYQFTTIPCSPGPPPCPEAHGRIRRNLGGDLVSDVGPDQGLGLSEGNPIFGLHLDKLSDDTLVLARDDRHINLWNPTTLSPTGVSAGAFGTSASVTISGIGVLSDDRVVVATDEGEILLRDNDLTSLQVQALFGDPLGAHEITAIGVASDDAMVVGTAGGELLRFA